MASSKDAGDMIWASGNDKGEVVEIDNEIVLKLTLNQN